jgi:hypothetical protein
LRCGYKAGLLTLLVAVLVLSTVFAIFVLPGVDLQPSALRAFRAAQEVFVAFFLLVSLATGCLLVTVSESLTPVFAGESCRLMYQPLFDRICVRLC